MNQTITIDYFHDAVCSWCYVLSPRLKKLAQEVSLDVRHHIFTLADTKEEMHSRFSSMAVAKDTILTHWEQIKAHEPSLLINIEGMRSQTFDFPHGGPAARACKAVEAQGGHSAHWIYFDRLQKAHFYENRNIADFEVLSELAGEQGLNQERFKQDWQSEAIRKQVKEDQMLAQQWEIYSVPTLVVNKRWRVSGAKNYEHLKSMILEAHQMSQK